MDGIVNGKIIKSLSDIVPVDSTQFTLSSATSEFVDLSDKRACIACSTLRSSGAYITLIFPQANYAIKLHMYGDQRSADIIDCSKNETTTFQILATDINYNDTFSYNNVTKILTRTKTLSTLYSYHYFVMW